MASLGLTYLVGGLSPQATAGINTVETDVGAEAVATSDDSPLLDCGEFTYDKRGLLGVREVYSERDATYSGATFGRARLTDQKNLEPYEADASLAGEWRSGRQSLRLNLGLNFTNSEQWGCSATIASRLQRQRDLQNKVLIPGNDVHTRTAGATYRYSLPGDIFALAYATEDRIASQTDANSHLDGSLDHAVSRSLLIHGLIGAGKRTGDFDPNTYSHGELSTLYQPARTLKLTLGELVELRSTREKRLTTTGTVTHASSRVWSEEVSATSNRIVHSASSVTSDAQASATVTASQRRWTYGAGAHRIEIDDQRHSASNWYTAVVTHALTRQQTLSANASYGSLQPSLMRMMTSAGLNYTAAFGAPSSRKGHATPRYLWTASYLVTRLVDLNNAVNTVRQVQAGILATF